MEKKGVIWAVNLYNIFLRNIHHGVQFVIFLPKNILGHKYFFSMKDLSLFEFSTLFTADLAGQLLLLCVKRVRKLAESLLCSLLHLFFPASWARELREKFKKKQNKLISILFLTHSLDVKQRIRRFLAQFIVNFVYTSQHWEIEKFLLLPANTKEIF